MRLTGSLQAKGRAPIWVTPGDHETECGRFLSAGVVAADVVAVAAGVVMGGVVAKGLFAKDMVAGSVVRDQGGLGVDERANF